MPLLEKSPNIQDVVGGSERKRSHDEFATDMIRLEGTDDSKLQATGIHPVGLQNLPPPVLNGNFSSPHGSPALTEAGSSTPNRASPTPLTPSKPSSNPSEAAILPLSHNTTQATTVQPPAAKRVKLTAAEREAKQKELEERKRQQEELKKQKAEVKAAAVKEREEKKKQKDEESRKKAEEREEKRKQKDEEREEKRKQKDEEKEEKRRQKEEETRKKEEEQEKKERSQMKLGNFFSIPKKKVEVIRDEDVVEKEPTPSPSKTRDIPYRRRFQPFFVKENTTWKKSIVNMDEETKSLKSRILDEAMQGKRALDIQGPRFDPVQLFALHGQPPKRGRLHHPVKHIMETAYREVEQASNQGADAAMIMEEARSKLAKVPFKIIAFSRDIRPPYYGTMTFKSFALGKGNMNRLARKPTERALPLDYDYDSEAEWQDGDEEGEDLDGDEDEEELDDEDDMDEFLDDSEDVGLTRGVFGGNSGPVSTGLYFENEGQAITDRVIYDHRLEIMLGEWSGTGPKSLPPTITEDIEHGVSIDPFSQTYWISDPKRGSKKAVQVDTATNMPPPAAPANAFAAMTSSMVVSSGEVKFVKGDIVGDLKQLVLDNKEVTKIGLVDLVYAKLRSNASRTEVKNTIEHVAERVGAGRQKVWALKAGHEIGA